MASPFDNDRPQQRQPRMGRSMWMWGFIFLFVLAYFAMQGQGDQSRRGKEISYSEFLDNVENRRVKSVIIEKESGTIRGENHVSGRSAGSADSKNFTTSAHPRSLPELETLLRGAHVTFTYEGPGIWKDILPLLAWAGLLALLFYFFVYRQMRGGGGMLSFGKSRAVRVTQDKNRKTFDDVAGVDEARAERSEERRVGKECRSRWSPYH